MATSAVVGSGPVVTAPTVAGGIVVGGLFVTTPSLSYFSQVLGGGPLQTPSEGGPKPDLEFGLAVCPVSQTSVDMRSLVRGADDQYEGYVDQYRFSGRTFKQRIERNIQ